jgi:mannose-P-dolichol utilization defect protein 1
VLQYPIFDSTMSATQQVPFPLDLVFTPHCFQSLVVDFNVLDDVDCAKAVISKALGYVIVVAAAILKLPIVINILKSKSVSGLSTKSLYLENTLYVCHFFYNFLRGSPFR